MYPRKSYSKHYISKEQLIFARTQLETTYPNDDKYLVQWETRSAKSRKFLNFLTPETSPENITSEIQKYLQGL